MKGFTEAHISGITWFDENKNGVLDDGENRLPNMEIQLTQYYWDETTAAWQPTGNYRFLGKDGETGAAKLMAVRGAFAMRAAFAALALDDAEGESLPAPLPSPAAEGGEDTQPAGGATQAPDDTENTDGWNEPVGDPVKVFEPQRQATGQQGEYLFDHLPGSVLVGHRRYLAGYQLEMLDTEENRKILDQYGVTEYLTNNGQGDSKFVLSQMQITSPNVEVEGGIVLSIQTENGVVDDSSKHNFRDVDEKAFNLLAVHNVDDMNAGFTDQPEPTPVTPGRPSRPSRPVTPEPVPDSGSPSGSISGIAWEDLANASGKPDGIRQDSEKRLPGVQVVLEQYYWKDSEGWKRMDGADRTATTGADGAYRFDGLPVTAMVNGKRVLLGYRVKVPSLLSGYDVTDYRTNGGTLDNDLNENTGYLMPDVLVLAQPALANTPADQQLYGYRINMAGVHSGYDLGLTPYRTTYMAGLVWNDQNRNGLQDEGEAPLPGHTVYLDVRVSGEDSTLPAGKPGELRDGILDDHSYRQLASAVTDEQGRYRFDDLSGIDLQTSEVYSYRVRMEKPASMEYVPLNVNGNTQDDVDNDYAHLNRTGLVLDQKYGVTEAVVLAEKLERTNFYGQTYRASRLTAHTTTALGLYQGQNRTVLGGRIYLDSDRDGILTPGERLLPNMEAVLYRYDADAGAWGEYTDLTGRSRVTTGNDGKYYFEVPVTDLDEASPSYRTPYRYRVSVRNTDPELSFLRTLRQKSETNAGTDGSVRYAEGVDYLAVMNTLSDVNEMAADAARHGKGLPQTGENLVLSNEYELAASWHDPYLEREAVSLADVRVDLGRGAALVPQSETFDPPKTGDNQNLVVPIVVLSVSLGGIAALALVLIWTRRRKRTD